MKLLIQETTRSQYSIHLLDGIFSKPIFRIPDFAQQLKQEFDIHVKTTSNLLRELRDAGILLELQAGRGQRPAVLCFPRLVNLAEGKEVI